MDPSEAILQLLAVAKKESFSQKVVKKKKSCVGYNGGCKD